MPQLLVRNLSEDTVRKLKLQAAFHGVSTEEEHRRVLEAAMNKADSEDTPDPYSSVLREEPHPGYSFNTTVAAASEDGFKAHLLALGEIDADFEFERPRTYSKRREADL